LKIEWKAKEHINTNLERFTLDSGLITSITGLEDIRSTMDKFMKGNGSTIECMVRESSLIVRQTDGRVSLSKVPFNRRCKNN